MQARRRGWEENAWVQEGCGVHVEPTTGRVARVKRGPYRGLRTQPRKFALAALASLRQTPSRLLPCHVLSSSPYRGIRHLEPKSPCAAESAVHEILVVAFG